MSKDVFLEYGFSSFLKKHEVGAGVDKDGCNYHDMSRWYKFGSANKYVELRGLVDNSIETGGDFTKGFLNDVAPETSRLFVDLDTNKHGEKLTDRELEEFALHFYRGVSNGLRHELFHFPDPTHKSPL